MIVAFDTYYYNGFLYTVGGVFENWFDKKVKYFVTSKKDCIGSSLDEKKALMLKLSSIMKCLSYLDINNIEIIILNGFAWISKDGINLEEGIGKRLQEAIIKEYNTARTIVGVSNNVYEREIPDSIKVTRNGFNIPLHITCSETCFTEHYSILINKMYGDERIPNILKSVTDKTRQLKRMHEKENGDSDGQSNVTFEDKPLEIDFGTFDEWMAETEKNGFRYL